MERTLWLTLLTSIPLAMYIGKLKAVSLPQSPIRDAVRCLLLICIASGGLGLIRHLLVTNESLDILAAIFLMVVANIMTISSFMMLLRLTPWTPSIRNRSTLLRSTADFAVFAGFAFVVPLFYVNLESSKLLNLCLDRIRTGQTGSASELLDELIRLRKIEPEIVDLRNRVRRDIEVLENRLEVESDMLSKAETFARLGRFDEALLTIPQIPDERPERWILMGAILMHQGRMEDSASAYRQAIVRIDRSELRGTARRQALRRCLNAIAYCFTESGDYRTAILERTRAASIDPSQAWSDQFEIACCNFELGNKRLAIIQMERLLPLLPNDLRKAGEDNLRQWRSESYHCLTGILPKPMWLRTNPLTPVRTPGF